MPKNPRRLAKFLVASGFGADIEVLNVNSDLDATATRTIVAFRAAQKMRVRRATYTQELATDGAKTLTVQNNTKAVAITSALTINGLGALGSAVFVLSTTDDNLVIRKDDVVTLIYTVTTAGVVAPGENGVQLEVQLLG